MTLTLLLDLDDTLLDSNMDDLIPAYFQALGKAMAQYVSPDVMLKHLMIGTTKMMAHDSPDETLQQVFERNFYPHLGVRRDVLDPEIARFYDEIFPTLQYLTKPRPAAVDFVQWAFAQGYRVAISTNPLFPQQAVDHRLRWAGLPPEKYPFEVISSFEKFHFSKPNPAYLGEVLGQMGWPEGPILVVGDDDRLDMLAAQGLGLSMFWIADEKTSLPEGRQAVAARGQIGDVRPWLESVNRKTLIPRYQTPDAIMATVKAIPAALTEALSTLSATDWRRRPDPTQWSLVEIVAHLRDVEREVNLPRIRTFLQKSDPFITADDTDVWAAERGYAEQNGPDALRDFFTARLETLTTLRHVKPADWQRAGRHAIFGPITLHEQLGFMAEHDRVHLRQAYSTLKQARL
ncbi:MAG: DinB family protein [Anaerolineales bacterium]|nr:DinB family protein [Anaerolineales bacterium]